MTFELSTALVGLMASLSSIVFAVIALRRTSKDEHKSSGKAEGVIFSDIGYIKACVDRVEKNLGTVDERYRNIAERLARLEEGMVNLKKQVDEI